MRPLRVLQFITPAGFYGAERWVIALANNMPRERVICDLAVTQEGEHQDLSVAEYYPRGVGEVHYLPTKGRFDPTVVWKLVRVIREREIHVIHTHGYKSDILGFAAARLAGIRCVSTPHGFPCNAGFKLEMFVRAGTHMLRYFDAVAPLSEELVADMGRFGIPASKTHFIRNGVDLSDIDQVIGTMPEKGTVTRKARTIGFIGQMIPRKGLVDLIKAFSQLYESDPNLRLELLGDGSQRAELEQLAASLPCAEAVEFLGFRRDRLERLTGFDAFVMTSSLEGIPRCLMEAMAARVPIVAYNIPGVDQLIEHGKTGLLAPHGDVAELTRQCQTLLANDKLRDDIREAGRHKVESKFSAARMAMDYEHLFSRLLDRPSRRGAERREAG